MANIHIWGIHLVRLGKPKSCRSDQFQIAAVVESIGHPPSKRNDAGETAVRESEQFYLGHLTRRTWEVHPAGSANMLVES
jgi:hypothetical protein